MKFSIQIAVTLIVGLLFLASLLSVFFAWDQEEITPLTLVAIANIVAVILLTFLITRGVMQPLRNIREVMKQVAQGSLERRVDLKATKEMEEVGEAFNDMIFRLHTARTEVEDVNKILEHRVLERTQQLQELASSLEEKVVERTRELQEKLVELERFERLAVGRELRMVELKDEIASLREQFLARQYAPDNVGTTKKPKRKRA